MRTNFADYPKGQEWRKRFEIFGNGSFNTDFEEWMVHRKSLRAFMSHQNFTRFLGRTVQECITKELIHVLDIVSEKELVVDFIVIIKWFMSYISLSICTGRKPSPIEVDHLEEDPLSFFFCLNHKVSWAPQTNPRSSRAGPLSNHLEEDALSKALDDACEAILVRYILPLPVWKLMKKLGIGLEKKYRKAWETIDCIFAHHASLYQDQIRKGTGKDGNHDVDGEDFSALKIYMIGHEQIIEHGTTYDVMRDNIVSLIFAAGDTTSITLSWFFWLVSKNPNVAAKIRQELEQIPPIHKSEIKEFFIHNSEELKKMVYLEAALKETLRLYPPAPYESRSPINPDILPSGKYVDENMIIIISIFSMGRMKSLWGEDRHEFKPESWITPDGKIRHEPSHKFFTFSSGPRICPGKDYAYIILKTFVATIMQNYHVHVLKNQHVIPKKSVVLPPKDSLKVIITKIASSTN